VNSILESFHGLCQLRRTKIENGKILSDCRKELSTVANNNLKSPFEKEKKFLDGR